MCVSLQVQGDQLGQSEPVWGCDAAAVEETHCIAICNTPDLHVASCGKGLGYLYGFSS